MKLHHLCVLLSVPAIFAAQQDTPDQAIRTFYREYGRLQFFGLPNAEQLAKLAPYLSTGLRAAIRRAQAERLRCINADPDGPGPWSEGDMFTSNAEGHTSVLQVGRPERGKYLVRFAYVENGQTFVWQDEAAVTREEGRWVIDDIVFRPAASASANLRRRLSGEGCPR